MARSTCPSRSPFDLSRLTGQQLDTLIEMIIDGMASRGQFLDDLDPGLARKIRLFFDRYLSRRKV